MILLLQTMRVGAFLKDGLGSGFVALKSTWRKSIGVLGQGDVAAVRAGTCVVSAEAGRDREGCKQQHQQQSPFFTC